MKKKIKAWVITDKKGRLFGWDSLGEFRIWCGATEGSISHAQGRTRKAVPCVITYEVKKRKK